MKKILIILVSIILIIIIASFFVLKEKQSSMYYIDKYTNTKIEYTSDEVTTISKFIKQLKSVDEKQIIDTYGEGTVYFGEQPQMFIDGESEHIYNTKLEEYIVIISDDGQDNYYISSKDNIDKLLDNIANISDGSIHPWEGE